MFCRLGITGSEGGCSITQTPLSVTKAAGGGAREGGGVCSTNVTTLTVMVHLAGATSFLKNKPQATKLLKFGPCALRFSPKLAIFA